MPARNTYVKTASGWEQIATTIQAIPQGLVPVVPTSVVNGSTTGDGLISFSAVTSVSVNGAFTSTYDSYLMVIDFSSASANTSAGLRMRAAGTDSSASYIMALNGIQSNASASNIATTGTSATFSYLPANYAGASASFTVINPAVAAQTKFLGSTTGSDPTYTNFTGRSGALYHNVATAYDGFTILTGGAQTLTGTIRVYGYSKGNLTQPQTIQPYSMSAGTASITGTGASSATATVTFPVGRFSQTPVINVTPATTGTAFFASFQSQTSTGFTARISIASGTFSTTQSVHWTATQMTSSSGAG